MALVDYDDSGSEDDSGSDSNLEVVESSDDPQVKTSTAPTVKIEVIPGGKAFEQEVDLAVIAALQGNLPYSEVKPSKVALSDVSTTFNTAQFKDKLKINRPSKHGQEPDEVSEPASKRAALEFNSKEFCLSTDPDSQKADITPVHAVGGGKHQLSSLIRNALDNREALEAKFAQERQNRKSVRHKYGF